jgi:hypothetical protein
MAFDASNTGAGPIGTISSVSDGQVIECTAGFLVSIYSNDIWICIYPVRILIYFWGMKQNAATHVDNVDKSQVSLVWTAPADFTSFGKLLSFQFWTLVYWSQVISWGTGLPLFKHKIFSGSRYLQRLSLWHKLSNSLLSLIDCCRL